MNRLTTRDGDIWEFDDLEETRENQYIYMAELLKRYIKQKWSVID